MVFGGGERPKVTEGSGKNKGRKIDEPLPLYAGRVTCRGLVIWKEHRERRAIRRRCFVRPRD